MLHMPATAYHLEGNRLVEQFHLHFGDALSARCATLDWFHHLPWVLLGLCAAARKDTAVTPPQAVYGSNLVLPGQFLSEQELPLHIFFNTLAGTLNRYTRHITTAAHQDPTVPTYLLNPTHMLICGGGHMPPL